MTQRTESIELTRLVKLADRTLYKITDILKTVNGRRKYTLSLAEVLNFLDAVDRTRLATGTFHSKSIKYNVVLFYNGYLDSLPNSYKYAREYTQLKLTYSADTRKFMLQIGTGYQRHGDVATVEVFIPIDTNDSLLRDFAKETQTIICNLIAGHIRHLVSDHLGN